LQDCKYQSRKQHHICQAIEHRDKVDAISLLLVEEEVRVVDCNSEKERIEADLKDARNPESIPLRWRVQTLFCGIWVETFADLSTHHFSTHLLFFLFNN